MDERFITLAAFVRGCGSVPQATPAAVLLAPAPAPAAAAPLGAVDFVHADAVHELTLMRLAAFEAFEELKDALLESLAQAVLGRELALAPADVAALAKRVVDASRELEPVSITVSAADAERARTPLPTRIDPTLEVGDLIVDVRDGALESRFTFRLQAALHSALLGAR